MKRRPLPHRQRALWPLRVGLTIAVLVLTGAAVVGCGPGEEPTLPAATVPAAAEAPTDTPEPTEAPTVEPSPTLRQRQAVTVTILHTNDVQGETDPCG